MVLDRDFRDTASAAALEKRLNNRVYIWKCHEAENLLQAPEAIREVLAFSGVETFKPLFPRWPASGRRGYDAKY